ncbi:MAG: outer membrane protein assembly factor BamB family protein [Myxococcaceae bacterium]
MVLGCESPAERAFVTPGNSPSRSGLSPAGFGVVLGNEAGAVLYVGPAGGVAWRASLGREIAQRPAVADQTVVAASLAGEWVGLGLADGKERWRLADRPPPAAALVAQGSRVFALCADGTVSALEAPSGALAWTRELQGPGDKKARPTTPSPEPALLAGALVVGALDTLFSLDLDDGRVKWRQPMAGPRGLAAHAGRVYAAGAEGKLTAFAGEDGKVAWTRGLGAEVSGGPSLALGALWVGLEDKTLLQLDPADGHEVWRASLPSPLRAGVAEALGMVLVPTSAGEGRLVALRPGEPKPVFEVRADSPLRTQPLVMGEVLVVAAADGRVLGYRLRAPR